jgi:hypothetical protein
MRCPAQIPDEEERLGALAEYGFDEEQPAANLDFVVQIAARMFDMPMAAINMICSDHVFFAASTGNLNRRSVRREVSFCAHAITQGDMLVVPGRDAGSSFPRQSVGDGGRWYTVLRRCPASGSVGSRAGCSLRR